jgi:hypothetical protein
VSGAAAIIFFAALFLAVVGVTVFVVAARRGMFSDRTPDNDQH